MARCVLGGWLLDVRRYGCNTGTPHRVFVAVAVLVLCVLLGGLIGSALA
jgi:hypothetical protein